MKKNSPKTLAVADDELRPEYDFSGGVRGKYAKALKDNGYVIRVHQRDGTFTERHVLGETAVTLAPDVWAYFPNSKAVNRALRTLITLIPEKRKTASRKAAGAERKPGARKRVKA